MLQKSLRVLQQNSTASCEFSKGAGSFDEKFIQFSLTFSVLLTGILDGLLQLILGEWRFTTVIIIIITLF